MLQERSIISLLILLFIIIGSLIFYEGIYNEPDLLRTAYNDLNEDESSLILVSPKDSKIEKVVVDDQIQTMLKENYDKKEVYKITFNYTATESNGNLIVYVATDKKTVVGKGFDQDTIGLLN